MACRLNYNPKPLLYWHTDFAIREFKETPGDLKKLLHLCAVSAITHYSEFRQYYDRKKTEGKHSMSILNAIRNKIALRAVAVIKNQKKYVDNYKKAA